MNRVAIFVVTVGVSAGVVVNAERPHAVTPPTCMGWPNKSAGQLRREAFASADAVLAGTIEALDQFTATMHVAFSWKGPASPIVSLSTGSVPSGPGMVLVYSESFQFKKGASYLVYAHGKGPKFSVSSCSLSAPLPQALPALVELDTLAKRQVIR